MTISQIIWNAIMMVEIAVDHLSIHNFALYANVFINMETMKVMLFLLFMCFYCPVSSPISFTKKIHKLKVCCGLIRLWGGFS